MRIPRCAPPWLMTTAQNLIRAGKESPGITNYAWVDTWDMALFWVHTRVFRVLAYRCENTVSESMQMQLLDAFSRACDMKLVSIVEETELSAICFFGGVPPEVELATLDFSAMDITRRK